MYIVDELFEEIPGPVEHDVDILARENELSSFPVVGILWPQQKRYLSASKEISIAVDVI